MPTLLLTIAFWTSVAWCAYTYLVYPLLLWQACTLVQARRDWRYAAGHRERRLPGLREAACPPVSVIIPVHNEGAFLADKLANLGELAYPAARLEIIFVADGCTDGSLAMLRAWQAQTELDCAVIEVAPGEGKASALNRGIARARHELLVLCDAATLLAPDAVSLLVRHFRNPEVGLVCGTLEFRGSAESRATEGVYWRYETLLRTLEARLGATLTASGALYAMRRECFRPLPPDSLIDDFIIPMQARAQGFRVMHDAEAGAVDFAADNIEGEFTRRVRLAVGSFRALGYLLRIRLDPVTRWAFLSHKLCRWLLPFVLMIALGSSALLLGHPLYRLAFIFQMMFYLWALLGWATRKRALQMRSACLAYYLLAMNAAFVVGLGLLIFRHGETKWH